MNDNYLIPANTKRGQLIFGVFYPIDLVIFLIGVGATFILLLVLPLDEPTMAILAVLPGIIAALLVLPVAYYHNVRQLLIEMFKFINSKLTGTNCYRWKGWCFLYESDDESDKSDKANFKATR